MHRIAILSAAGALALAGQATAAPVQCPSISVTRTPVPGHAHRAARPKATAAAVKHHGVAARPRVHKAAAKKVEGPRPAVVASSALPVLAPILPPDTMPATTPILAPGVTPATPIIGYKLQRSVRMVACAPVPLVTTTQADFVAPPTAPGASAAEIPFIPTAFQPPGVNQFQTSPPADKPPPDQPPPDQPPTITPPPDTPPPCCEGPPPDKPPPDKPPPICCDRPPPPNKPPPGPVPEPATWAMLIVGFFGLGAQLRRAARRARIAGA